MCLSGWWGGGGWGGGRYRMREFKETGDIKIETQIEKVVRVTEGKKRI